MKATFTFFAIVCGIVSTISSNAQILILPNQPDQLVANTNPYYVGFVNCDALSTSSGTLRAFFWTDNSGIGKVKIEDDAGGTAFLNIPNFGTSGDIVLADDLSAPGVGYIVGVVYLSANWDATFNTYKVTGVGSGTLSISLLSSSILNAPGTISEFFPHIDMFPDPSNMINGLPSMHRFIISWEERNISTNIYSMKAAYGDISNPISYTPVVVATGSYAIQGDVAASFNVLTGIPYAYLAMTNFNTGFIEMATLDCNTNTVINNITIPKFGGVRIEAMGLYDPSVSNNPWTIAAEIPNSSGPGGADDNTILVFNPNNLGGIPCSSGLGFDHDVYSLANIAAGVGFPFAGNFSNHNYTVGWYSPNHRMFVTRAIDYVSGNISSNYHDYYQVDTILLSPSSPHPKIFFDNCSSSNSGEQLLTAWINQGTQEVLYKQVDNSAAFKPSSVDEMPGISSLSLSPNPGHDQIMIKGVNGRNNISYSIVDLSGRRVASGKLAGAETIIDIQRLSPGMYSLMVSSSDQAKSFQFVKE